MPLTLSDDAQVMVGDLPVHLQADPTVQAILTAGANRLAALEDRIVRLREKLIPSRADDEFGTLAIYERIFGLPVNPVGATLGQRQAKVLGFMQANRSGAATDWRDNMTRALGSTNWSYQEGPGAYEITIFVPYAAGTYNAAAVEQIAALITPAHLAITVSYSEGFIVGVSRVGIEVL